MYKKNGTKTYLVTNKNVGVEFQYHKNVTKFYIYHQKQHHNKNSSIFDTLHFRSCFN